MELLLLGRVFVGEIRWGRAVVMVGQNDECADVIRYRLKTVNFKVQKAIATKG